MLTNGWPSAAAAGAAAAAAAARAHPAASRVAAAAPPRSCRQHEQLVLQPWRSSAPASCRSVVVRSRSRKEAPHRSSSREQDAGAAAARAAQRSGGSRRSGNAASAPRQQRSPPPAGGPTQQHHHHHQQQQQQAQAAAPDPASLLQALESLASRSTIVLGSHQAYAILETLEGRLLGGQQQQQQQLLAGIPTDVLASGLWAMARLQLQPDAAFISAVAQHLLAPAQLPRATAASTSSSSRLAAASARTLGTLCYGLNFFLLRDRAFWAAAARAALPHLRQLKPANLANLLQGVAASGWVVHPDQLAAAQQQQHQWSLAGSAQQQPASGPAAAAAADGAAVLQLLVALDAHIAADPRQLRFWRLRDVAQLAQSYALAGYACARLFAVLAQHLLEPGDPLSPAEAARQVADERQQAAAYGGWGQQQQQYQQQQQQQQRGPAGRALAPDGSSSSRSVLTAALGASGRDGGPPSKPWHDRGRGPARLAQCRASDAVALAWAYVHAFCANRLLLQELAVVLTARAGRLHAADVCRLLWAYATADVADTRMLGAVTSAVCEEMHSVLPRTAAGAVWALARMRYSSAPAFLEAALDRLAVCLECSSLGRPGHTPTRVPPSQQQQEEGGKAQPPSAAAAAAAAQQQQQQPSLLQQLYEGPPPAWLSGGPTAAGEGQEARGDARAGELALARSSSSSSSSSGESPSWLQQQLPGGVDAPPAAAAANSSNGSSAAPPQQQQQLVPLKHQPGSGSSSGSTTAASASDIAQAVWACGRLRHYNAALFTTLRPRLPGLLPSLSDAQLVEVVWGLARLSLYDSRNMDAAATELLARAPRLSGPLAALAAWSFASLRHRHTPLLDALAARAAALAAQGRLAPLDARQLVYAAARLNHRPPVLLRACAKALTEQLHRVGVSVGVTSLWGFAVAGHLDERMFEGVLEIVRAVPPKSLRPQQLLQLFQALTLLQDGLGAERISARPQLQLPPQLAAAGRRQWLTTTRRAPRSIRGDSGDEGDDGDVHGSGSGGGSGGSRFAAAVGGVLRRQLGLAVAVEALTDDGLFSIDLAVTWRGRRVAVEVDGPDHFTRSAPHVLLGSSAAKQACLQARGWAVASVPFHHWQRISGSGGGGAGEQQRVAAARAAYLRAALDAAVEAASVPRALWAQMQPEHEQLLLSNDGGV